jgi:hypothetical protein
MVEEQKTLETKKGGLRGGLVIGLVLIGLGAILLVDNLFPELGFGRIWPVLIIIWGLVSGFVPPMSGGRMLRGVLIGTVGTILLSNTLGIVPFNFWVDLIALWPVFLIALGFAILGGATRSRKFAALSPIIIIATLIFAFVYRGVLFRERGLTTFRSSREMISGARTGSASVDMGVGDLDVASTSKLYSVEASETSVREKPQLAFETSDSSVELKIESPRDRDFYLGTRRRRWRILLSKEIDWKLAFDTGVSEAHLDLSDLKASTVDVDGGVGDITVRFGDRVRRTTATINTGVSRMRILVPRSVGVRMTVDRGLSTSDFENITLRRIGGDDRTTYETPNFGGAGKKLLLDIDMGVSSFVVEGY